MPPSAPLDAAGVAHYFALILGRPPESDAVVEHYRSMNLTAEAFARVLLDSEEVNERYRRRLALQGMAETAPARAWPVAPGARPVLLFGAYGNGNLGDAVQAEAVAGLLRRLLPGPLNLAASSWERRAAYALPGGVCLAGDALLRGDLLPPPDGLVVIGGGGLLGAPHFPLYAERWARWFAQRGTPWALLGIGGSAEAMAEPDWARAYRILVEGAAFVGVRDAETLAAAQAINPRAVWFPDPILARAVLDAPAPDAAADWAQRPRDVLIIPRFPNSPQDAAANQAALAWRRRLVAAGREVAILSMERVLDAGVLRGEEVVYAEDWATVERLCRESRLVLSLRLHGAIAAVAAGCVVHGLVQPKIGDLMRRLGLADWFEPGAFPARDPDLSAAAAEAFRAALSPGLHRLREALTAAMVEAGRALTAAG